MLSAEIICFGLARGPNWRAGSSPAGASTIFASCRGRALARKGQHKKQHWIPAAAYLNAWADPDVPSGRTSFVHVFSRDGGEHRRRAPSNIFHETDLYTIKGSDGARDLRLEHGLTSLETAFWKMRRDLLERRKLLPLARHAKLLAFVAAMHARTPALRDHQLRFWTDLQNIGEEVEENMRSKSPEERKRIAALSLPSSDKRRSMSLDEVRKVTASPMQHLFSANLAAEVTLLTKMRCVILCGSGRDPGFITSDNPVVWYDPDAYKRPPLFRGASFSCPQLQITLPLSPWQMLMLVHGEPTFEYLNVSDANVREANRITRFHCDKEFVCRRGTVDPYWLDAGAIPPDAWELSEEARDLEETRASD